MKTIILPGYSPRNKSWADEIKSKLNLGHKILVHDWEHWQGAKSLSPKREIARILQEVGGDEVNIIAKSVGTYVCAKLIPELGSRLRKVILCGIPSTSEKRKEIYQKVFSNFSRKDLICFQNAGDPFVRHEEVKRFMAKINPKIDVVKKDRNDHNYPFPDEFNKFLQN